MRKEEKHIGGDFGEDIVKSLLTGCLIYMAILGAAITGIYYLIKYLWNL